MSRTRELLHGIDGQERRWIETDLIRASAYRYAPESLRVWRRTSAGWKEDFSVAHDTEIGTLIVCGKPAEAIAILKRRYRSEARKSDGVTYGFFFEGSQREYVYFSQIYTLDQSLEARLATYKAVKSQMEARKWKHETGQTATLGGDFGIESVVRHFRQIDKMRPCSIRVRM